MTTDIILADTANLALGGLALDILIAIAVIIIGLVVSVISGLQLARHDAQPL